MRRRPSGTPAAGRMGDDLTVARLRTPAPASGVPSTEAVPPPAMNDVPKTNWIGKDLARFEDARILVGHGRYVDDIAPPGTLHADFVRSPYARGRLERVDAAAAIDAPGVIAIFTGDDLAGLGGPSVNRIDPGMHLPIGRLLARDEVMAVGDPVALVIAESRAAAIDGADLVEFDIDPTDPRLDPVADPGTGLLYDDVPDDRAVALSWNAGDVEAAFAGAATVVRSRVVHPRLAPLSLEPRAALADPVSDDNMLTMWLSTQTPHRARTDLARLLDIDKARIRVVAPDVGGAFGMKASLYPEDVAVAWAALRLGRPVKWISQRSEDFVSATHGRGATSEGALALDADGRIVGLKARMAHPLGHWLPYSAAVPAWNGGRILPGPYRVDAVDVEACSTVTNTAAVGIYRGAGRPEATMILERLIDDAARAVGIDPVELRRRNLIPPDAFPYETPTGEVLDSGDYAALIERATANAGYDELRAEQARRRDAGELVGIGVALYVEPCGRGWESARVALGGDGRIVVATGATAQGQGRETAYAQIAASVLNVAAESIEVRHGDTAITPQGIGALASRSTAIGGGALVKAAKKVREAARALAARLLQAAVEDIVLDNGGFAVAGESGRRTTWRAVAEEACRGGEAGLSADAMFSVSTEAWASGCCIAVMAIDVETGCPTIENMTWVDDAGTVVNPRLVRGQIIGGIAQGVGEAMMERIVYDEDGQLITGSLMDYAVPRAGDMPPVDLDHIATPSPNNPLGAKGVGEAGPIGAPAALLNAALDALAPLGVRELGLPLTGETIWRAIAKAHAKE